MHSYGSVARKTLSGLTLLWVTTINTQAAEVSASVTLASEYVYRGQAMSGNDPAVSAGVDYQHDSGFFGGAWATTINLDSPVGSRGLEADIYLGYHFSVPQPLELSALVMHYSYPDSAGQADYDFTEYMLSATLYSQYSLQVAYADDVYGLGIPGRLVEMRADWPLGDYWVLGIGAGRNDIRVPGWDSYLYWDAGVSSRWSRVTADLRWYDNEEIDGIFARWSAGSRIVASLSVGF